MYNTNTRKLQTGEKQTELWVVFSFTYANQETRKSNYSNKMKIS